MCVLGGAIFGRLLIVHGNFARFGFKSTKGYMKQCQINHRHKALAYALTSLLLDAAHDDEATLLEDGRCCIWFSA